MDFSRVNFQASRPLLREITADKLNTILTEIRRNKPKGERGISVRQDGNGTYIGLAANAGAGNITPTTTHPFKISSVKNEDDEYVVTVRPGTINNVIPTNWDIEETIIEDELNYVVLQVEATANKIISCTIALEQSPPTAEPDPIKWGLPEEFDVLLGFVRNSQVWQIINTNLSFNAAKRITTDREGPQIGELPYDNWYVWQKQ
jgi:hypothetical protein